MVIAAHPDDEVLGCGGTILKHIAQGDSVSIVFMTNGESSRGNIDYKQLEIRNSACAKSMEVLSVKSVYHFDFPDNKMDSVPLLDVVKKVELAINEVKPTTIYTHFSDDLNVDHRVTHNAVMTACRPQSWSPVKNIFTFEVLSSTEWNSTSKSKFNPNKFEDVSSYWDLKMRAMTAYEEELREFPHSRSVEAINALAVLRGATVGLHKAEAFQVERIIG